LYLLHWRGSHPLAQTVEGFEALRRAGKIVSWGVSNFDVDDLDALAGVPDGGNCASNQVLYHLGSRGVEWGLLAKCQAARIMVMAYSPLGQGALLRKPALGKIAAKHACDPAAVALAWVLRQRGVITIPKATQPEHVRANIKALDVKLDQDDLAALDSAFPPPRRARPLDMSCNRQGVRPQQSWLYTTGTPVCLASPSGSTWIRTSAPCTVVRSACSMRSQIWCEAATVMLPGTTRWNSMNVTRPAVR